MACVQVKKLEAKIAQDKAFRIEIEASCCVEVRLMEMSLRGSQVGSWVHKDMLRPSRNVPLKLKSMALLCR